MPMKLDVEIPPGIDLSPELTQRLLDDFSEGLYDVKRMRVFKYRSEVKWMIRVSRSPSDAVMVMYTQRRKSFFGEDKGDPFLVVSKMNPFVVLLGVFGPFFRSFQDDSLLYLVTRYLREEIPDQVRNTLGR